MDELNTTIVEVGNGVSVGYLRCGSREFPICVRNSGQDDSLHLDCCPSLKQLLEDSKQVHLVKLRLKQHKCAKSFALDLKEITEKALGKQLQKLDNSNKLVGLGRADLGYYEWMVKEIGNLGWDCITSLDENMCTIEILCKDEAQREHILKITRIWDENNASNNSSSPCFTFRFYAQLPLPFTPRTMSQVNNSVNIQGTGIGFFRTLKAEFETELKKYQKLWDILDDVDRNTWVLEPKMPDRSILFRRIVVGDNCSIHVHVSAKNPTSMCELDFLGSEAVVKPLRERFNHNAHTWSWNQSLRENLSRILEIDFPKPTPKNKEMLKVECGICYSFRLQLEPNKEDTTCGNENDISMLPNQVCDNKNCGTPYHEYCLSTWLRSLTDTRHSFDTMFGKCPMCYETISIRSASSAAAIIRK